MWKTFEYSGKQRVAFLPPKGPAFQVMESGKRKPGFRSYKSDLMTNIASADNLFHMVPIEFRRDYPELEKANG